MFEPFLRHLPAAQNFGVGFQLPCRGKACGGMPGAMARIALRGPPRRFQRPHFHL
jgi:hypothetical protein